MRKHFNVALLVMLSALAACSGDNKEDSKVTQTRMDDIDSIEGTINDDMIDTTNSNAQDENAAMPDSKAGTEKSKAAETAGSTENNAKPAESDVTE